MKSFSFVLNRSVPSEQYAVECLAHIPSTFRSRYIKDLLYSIYARTSQPDSRVLTDPAFLRFREKSSAEKIRIRIVLDPDDEKDRLIESRLRKLQTGKRNKEITIILLLHLLGDSDTLLKVFSDTQNIPADETESRNSVKSTSTELEVDINIGGSPALEEDTEELADEENLPEINDTALAILEGIKRDEFA